ncbi:MAG TPA: nucleotide exchange factor GrpE [Methylomirabilota bacterium]
MVDRRWWARGEAAAAEEPGRSRRPAYVEELEQRLADRERELREYARQVKAASAEFDEARVRARREVAREVERGKRAILGELLEVLDNLDRAIGAGESAASVEALLEGVRLVRTQFLSRLDAFGIAPIDALGQPFDPRLHEAVTTVPAARDEDEDRVLGIVRPGYRIGDDVLRPAMVAVGKKE